MSTIYCAADQRSELLEAELGPAAVRLGGGLYQLDGPPRPAAWAANVWFDVERLEVPSIKIAARTLRARGGWWAAYPLAAHRRSALIAQALPQRRDAALRVPGARPRALGAYALLDPATMLAASRTARPFPHGVPSLVEDRTGPPARAYRKLWEALLLLDRCPRPGERVFDLGSAPGSWTWALAACGCTVISVDKAPLDPAIAALPNVTHQRGSAFAVDARHERADWIFSDIICYPSRLVTLIERWLSFAACARFVITIKLQGVPDPGVVAALRAIDHARVVHLHHNKHELTFLRHPDLRGPDPSPWPWAVSDAVETSA